MSFDTNRKEIIQILQDSETIDIIDADFICMLNNQIGRMCTARNIYYWSI
jgi:Mg2+/Co2+ transporter CorC